MYFFFLFMWDLTSLSIRTQRYNPQLFMIFFLKPMVLFIITMGRGSSVGTASNTKTQKMCVRVHGAARDFSPRVDFQCRLCYIISTAPACNRLYQYPCAHEKSQTLAAIPLFGVTKMLHTLTGMGSVVLAAAVPYPGKVTWIFVWDKEVLKKHITLCGKV